MIKYIFLSDVTFVKGQEVRVDTDFLPHPPDGWLHTGVSLCLQVIRRAVVSEIDWSSPRQTGRANNSWKVLNWNSRGQPVSLDCLSVHHSLGKVAEPLCVSLYLFMVNKIIIFTPLISQHKYEYKTLK